MIMMIRHSVKIARMGEASAFLRVSEDKKQIGRAKAMTEEEEKERIARTVQVRNDTVMSGTVWCVAVM